MTELKYTSLIKIIIKEENFKWHLEAFASELFICFLMLSPKGSMCKVKKSNGPSTEPWGTPD